MKTTVTILETEEYAIEDYPWQDPIKENAKMLVFIDGYPVSKAGHFLFVPKTNDINDVAECLTAATKQGAAFVEEGRCDGFNVGLNYGASAGQTIEWPHVHLILRVTGDCANPIGGVRNVIPGKGDYTTNETATTDIS